MAGKRFAILCLAAAAMGPRAEAGVPASLDWVRTFDQTSTITVAAARSELRAPETSATMGLDSAEVRALWRFADHYQTMSDLHLIGFGTILAGAVVGGAMLNRSNSTSGLIVLGVGTGMGAILEIMAMFEEQAAANSLQPFVEASVRGGLRPSSVGWTTLPTPQGVKAGLEGPWVALTWQDVPGFPGMAGYVVRRGSSDDVAGVLLTPEPITDTTFRDRTAHPKVAYRYWVTVRTTDGREGVPSDKVSVSLP